MNPSGKDIEQNVPKVFLMFAMHRRLILPEWAVMQRGVKTKKQIRQNVTADLIAYLKITGKK